MSIKKRRRYMMTLARRAYLDSAAAKIQRAEAIKKAWAAQAKLPRCGAKAKSTGLPCRRMPLANGRCKFHGGATPSGRDWHVAQLGNAEGSIQRAERKINDLVQRKKARQNRLAKMTPKERERHAAWHRKYKPGSKSGRERARQDREAFKLLDQSNGARARQDGRSDSES